MVGIWWPRASSAAFGDSAHALFAQGLLGIAATSLLLACGRATFGPVVDVIPGNQDIFFRRFGMGLRLAGIYLAGIGAVTLWRAAVRIVDMTVPELVPACRDRRGLLVLRRCLVAGLGVLLLTPAWYQIGSLDRSNAARYPRGEAGSRRPRWSAGR